MSGPIPWTSFEIRRLRESFADLNDLEIASLIPRHSLMAIQSMAKRLNIRRKKRDWKAICAAHKPAFNLMMQGE